MQIDLDTLPDDPATLHQMLREVVTTAAHQQGELHAENDKLRLLIQLLLRQQFGRRSEQLSPDQLQFGLEDLEQSVAENQAGQDAANPAEQQQRRTARPNRSDSDDAGRLFRSDPGHHSDMMPAGLSLIASM